VLRQSLHGQINYLRLFLDRVVVLKRGLPSRWAVAGKHSLLRRLALSSWNGVRRWLSSCLFGHLNGRVFVEDRSQGLGYHRLRVVVLLHGFVSVTAGLEVVRSFAAFGSVFVLMAEVVHVNGRLLHGHIPCVVRLLQHAGSQLLLALQVSVSSRRPNVHRFCHSSCSCPVCRRTKSDSLFISVKFNWYSFFISTAKNAGL